MENNTKAIYISPNYDNETELFNEMSKMSDAEKVKKVEELNTDEVVLLTLDELEFRFNELEWISDYGYLFFVKV